MKKATIVLAIMAMVLLTGCSTAENAVSVGDVHNSECSHTWTRSADADEEHSPEQLRRIDSQPLIVKLIREGKNISGEIRDYRIGCSHGDLYVDCQEDDKKLNINVNEKKQHNMGDIGSTCLCFINIYFTLYDVEGDAFQLSIDGKDIGDVSFKENNVVELTYP